MSISCEDSCSHSSMYRYYLFTVLLQALVTRCHRTATICFNGASQPRIFPCYVLHESSDVADWPENFSVDVFSLLKKFPIPCRCFSSKHCCHGSTSMMRIVSVFHLLTTLPAIIYVGPNKYAIPVPATSSYDYLQHPRPFGAKLATGLCVDDTSHRDIPGVGSSYRPILYQWSAWLRRRPDFSRLDTRHINDRRLHTLCVCSAEPHSLG